MYVCIYVLICLSVRLFAYLYAYMYYCMYSCIYLGIYKLYLNFFVFVFGSFLCMYVLMYVCIYVCTYVCMHVCTYVCMYVWSVDDVANLMPIFCFMSIQGEQLISASIYKGDMATVQRLLEENPNLVRYKNPVRSSIVLCYRTRPAASSIHMYPSIIIATSS
jgi:hypothetical protein